MFESDSKESKLQRSFTKIYLTNETLSKTFNITKII